MVLPSRGLFSGIYTPANDQLMVMSCDAFLRSNMLRMGFIAADANRTPTRSAHESGINIAVVTGFSLASAGFQSLQWPCWTGFNFCQSWHRSAIWSFPGTAQFWDWNCDVKDGGRWKERTLMCFVDLCPFMYSNQPATSCASTVMWCDLLLIHRRGNIDSEKPMSNSNPIQYIIFVPMCNQSLAARRVIQNCTLVYKGNLTIVFSGYTSHKP